MSGHLATFWLTLVFDNIIQYGSKGVYQNNLQP